MTCAYYEYCDGDMHRCGNSVEGKTNFCASHNKYFRDLERKVKKEEIKRNSLIAKSKEVKPRKSIAKVSDKQKTKNEAYNERVKVWKVENPKCKAMVDPDCTGETRDCHHMKKRGDLLMVEKYWLPVCGFCHDWIGRNSDEARRKGLTINHLEPEFQEPHKI